MMFALIMVIVLTITGLIWLLDIFVLSKKRAANAKEPILVEYSKSFFPVILLVFFIRSFVAEPFKIPSGSMMPTLLAGDFILVSKFSYGIRVPILNYTMIEVDKPKRGDVFVFHYPPKPSIDYIKRVVGLPGDVIEYKSKTLYINNKKIEQTFVDKYPYVMNEIHHIEAKEFKEALGNVNHSILIHDLPGENFKFEVPQGHYLAFGDNRDNSADSRVWGFVPEHNLVGRAFFIWFNFGELKRIGTIIH
ncbi:signal peptidase I [Candidatus Methylopumilus planktonicus]|uniref:signal peptidase I n=1 Tax=Candidatus Methylopumilus planktonicus TaxID=1581557 RepID=UPI00111CDC86|nr:signal peptidase I [Candidatus Methylopumilus planktonicus]QDD07143.1 signal peptidase I [Candidatus Methylopumilus planktonicus]QDD08472.1 signal peptidase I [Candidatus Methylopumilus planktonicus]QDD09795.1 signal peptidase I [Candidatus Methylopumilus planktonicus]